MVSKKFSFTSLEKEFLPEFREKVNTCEDVIDLENLFSHTMAQIVGKIFVDLKIRPGDIIYDGREAAHFCISPRLLQQSAFKEILANSDLARLSERFASVIHHHRLRLKRHPRKTERLTRK